MDQERLDLVSALHLRRLEQEVRRLGQEAHREPAEGSLTTTLKWLLSKPEPAGNSHAEPKAEKKVAVFRPSKIPKLEECIRFEEKDEETPFSVRGNDKHHTIAEVLSGKLKLEKIEDKETYGDAVWVKNELETRGIVVKHVEWEVPLIIDGQDVWKCTTDVVGLDANRELWIIDHKSGDKRDYSGQFVAYAKEVMHLYKYKRCMFLVLYTDLREAYEFDVELEDAEERITRLYHEWLSREHRRPVINDYCDYCARRGFCEAWLEQGERALAPIPQAQRAIFDIEKLSTDPVRLGEFYGAYKRLVKLVETEWKLKEAVLEFLLNGVDVPGFIKVRDASYRTVDIEQVLSRVVTEMGIPKAASFLSVSIPKMLEAWSQWTQDPLPVEITTVSPPTYHCKVETPRGRGRAMAARKQRASTRRKVQRTPGNC